MQKYVIRYDSHTNSDYFRKPRKYAGKKTLCADEASATIICAIMKNDSLMIARFGSTELYNMGIFDLNYKPKFELALSTLTKNSGFFPNNEELAKKFVNDMHTYCSEIDILAFWNMFREEFYIKSVLPKNVALLQLRYLEPWFSSTPWTAALENRKVLVIHPFEKTILEQYTKRERIFPNSKILPKFELKTLKAVQTVAGQSDERFDDWFDALEFMFNQALQVDFEIALIGCGAYGLPLAAKLKLAGKKAIHMGGVLQILFGIKGKRWDNDPVVSAMYNEFWVRPDISECPIGSQTVEGGCYW